MSGSTNIQQTEQEIIEEFALFDSWDDKYEYIIDLGKKLAVLEDEYKTDNNKVKGCQSTVWLAAFYKNGIITYKADSDAVIVKGLISRRKQMHSSQTKTCSYLKMQMSILNHSWKFMRMM